MENKETGRTDLPLMKLVLRLGVAAMLNAMLIFTAIPHIFFGFGGTADANIAQMTRQAMSIGGVCMSLQEFENTVLDSIITGIVAGYLERGTEINRISVVNEFDEESLQWMTAINATAHQQNLNEITVDEIRELCTARLSFSFSLFQEEDAVLQITIHKLDPDEWMDKLGFDKEARTWAGAIFETFSESGAMEKYGDYYKDATDYSGDNGYSGIVQHGSSYGNEIDTSHFIDPTTKNNHDLAAYTIQAWENNWGYVWGTFGNIMQSEDYPTIKNICEGRELPAYEASSEFVSRTAGELDDLLRDVGGDQGALHTLEKLQQKKETAEWELAELLERLRRSSEPNATLEKAAVDAANRAESLGRQTEAVGKLIDATTAQHKDALAAIVAGSVKAAVEKAEETQSILAAWGNDSGGMERSEVNLALLDTVSKSENLKAVAKYLGRFREIFAQGKKNGYAYGRGEKYSLELGKNLSRALTSELAMLASPETMPLFLRKYQRRQIKQYQRREPIRKGAGDIICCLDESDSTRGDNAAWGKAVALTLLDVAAEGGRSFALIHFSGAGGLATDVFRLGEYTAADKMAAAERFLGGGTDFKPPLREAISLMENAGFERADVVFITDGECILPDEFIKELREKQTELGFAVTGILLDAGRGMDFSLKEFCEKVYRTSELMGDEIVRDIVVSRL